MRDRVLDYLTFIDTSKNYMIDSNENIFSIIIFPLNPKPHELVDNDDHRNNWIKQKWRDG